MALFILFIVSMGIKMATSSQELYEEDYYEQGEKHADRMAMEIEARNVNTEYISSENSLSFEFDSIGWVENVKLVHLSNAESDLQIVTKDSLPSFSKLIPISALNPGIWVMEAEGTVNQKKFFIKKLFVK
jgi:hypothetical protein